MQEKGTIMAEQAQNLGEPNHGAPNAGADAAGIDPVEAAADGGEQLAPPVNQNFPGLYLRRKSFDCVIYDLIYLYIRRDDTGSPRGIQQFPDNRVDTINFFQNFRMVLELLRFSGRLAHQLNKKGDGVKRIADIVGHTGRKIAHCRELFRLDNLFMSILKRLGFFAYPPLKLHIPLFDFGEQMFLLFLQLAVMKFDFPYSQYILQPFNQITIIKRLENIL